MRWNTENETDPPVPVAILVTATRLRRQLAAPEAKADAFLTSGEKQTRSRCRW